jgi:hypothetical protein
MKEHFPQPIGIFFLMQVDVNPPSKEDIDAFQTAAQVIRKRAKTSSKSVAAKMVKRRLGKNPPSTYESKEKTNVSVEVDGPSRHQLL